MGIVNVLDISVANLIAAGEVVERPCNAVKELVENAIDAGATAVTVEIRRGGVASLRVTDNGCGMSGEDAVLAIRRHATSKLKTASDLAAIGTLGFRGEALAAITAVSEYRIMTKRAADAEGTLVAGAYGKTEEVSPTGCPNGTTIICERLFATTPARLKFLKSDASEASAVAQMLEKLAVSRPEISFRFLSDGNLKFSTAGDGVLKNAIYSVYGSAFSSGMLAVQGGSRGIRVEGYVSSPELVRGNRAMQHFFVNDRSVRSKTLTASLEAAFASYLPPSKYPSCVLNLIIPLSLVDVNIHPAKLEVKFSEEKAVFDALYSAVRGTLVSGVSRPVLELTEKTVRMDGNLSVEAKRTPQAEQTTLDVMFDRAAKKGATVEQDVPPVKKETAPTPATYTPTAHTDIKGDKALVDDDDIPVDVPVLPDTPARRPTLHAGSGFSALERYTKAYGNTVKTSESFSDVRKDAQTERVKPAPAITQETKTAPPEAPVANTEPPATAPAPTQTAHTDEPIPAIGDTDAAIRGATAKPIPDYRIVGEVFASYVILEVGDRMLLVDKHAAHERINFERLRANMEDSAHHVQLLLAPDTLPLCKEEAAICREYREELEKVGFEFTLTDTEAQIGGIPQDFGRNEAIALFAELIKRAAESGGSILTERRVIFEKALYQSACKSAIKAGRVYDIAHLRWICDNLLRYDCIRFCPHGRPVAFELSKSELDARFGRT